MAWLLLFLLYYLLPAIANIILIRIWTKMEQKEPDSFEIKSSWIPAMNVGLMLGLIVSIVFVGVGKMCRNERLRKTVMKIYDGR